MPANEAVVAMNDDARAAIVQARRLDLRLPPATLPGVVANLALLAEHHAVLRAAQAEAGAEA